MPRSDRRNIAVNRTRLGRTSEDSLVGLETWSKRYPGGRPKVAAEIRALARDHGANAIERLVALMDSKNESVAVRAAEALLDRGYGRPVHGTEVSGRLR